MRKRPKRSLWRLWIRSQVLSSRSVLLWATFFLKCICDWISEKNIYWLHVKELSLPLSHEPMSSYVFLGLSLHWPRYYSVEWRISVNDFRPSESAFTLLDHFYKCLSHCTKKIYKKIWINWRKRVLLAFKKALLWILLNSV